MDLARSVHSVGVFLAVVLSVLFVVGWLFFMSLILSGVIKGLRQFRKGTRIEEHRTRWFTVIRSIDFKADPKWTIALRLRRWLLIDVVLLIATGVVLSFVETALRR